MNNVSTKLDLVVDEKNPNKPKNSPKKPGFFGKLFKRKQGNENKTHQSALFGAPHKPIEPRKFENPDDYLKTLINDRSASSSFDSKFQEQVRTNNENQKHLEKHKASNPNELAPENFTDGLNLQPENPQSKPNSITDDYKEVKLSEPTDLKTSTNSNLEKVDQYDSDWDLINDEPLKDFHEPSSEPAPTSTVEPKATTVPVQNQDGQFTQELEASTLNSVQPSEKKGQTFEPIEDAVVTSQFQSKANHDPSFDFMKLDPQKDEVSKPDLPPPVTPAPPTEPSSTGFVMLNTPEQTAPPPPPPATSSSNPEPEEDVVQPQSTQQLEEEEALKKELFELQKEIDKLKLELGTNNDRTTVLEKEVYNQKKAAVQPTLEPTPPKPVHHKIISEPVLKPVPNSLPVGLGDEIEQTFKTQKLEAKEAQPHNLEAKKFKETEIVKTAKIKKDAAPLPPPFEPKITLKDEQLLRKLKKRLHIEE